jgi:hypothetical protein
VPLRTPVDATAVGPGRKLAHVAKLSSAAPVTLPTNPVLHGRSTYFHRRHLSGLAACGSHQAGRHGVLHSIGIERLRRAAAGLALVRAGPRHVRVLTPAGLLTALGRTRVLSVRAKRKSRPVAHFILQGPGPHPCSRSGLRHIVPWPELASRPTGTARMARTTWTSARELTPTSHRACEAKRRPTEVHATVTSVCDSVSAPVV